MVLNTGLACENMCEKQCLAFSAEAMCFEACGCPKGIMADDIKMIQVSDIGRSELSHTKIEALYQEKASKDCYTSEGCGKVYLFENLIADLPPFRWESVRPKYLITSAQAGYRKNRLVSCSDCISMIGDDYWECISDYCSEVDISKYSFAEEIKRLKITNDNIVNDVVTQSLLSKNLQGSETESRLYEETRINSFNSMKSLMGELQDVQFSQRMQKIVNYLDGDCAEVCGESKCSDGNEACFDSCLSSCDRSSELQELLTFTESLTSETVYFFSLLLFCSLGILYFTAYSKSSQKRPGTFTVKSNDSPYKLLI